MPAYEFDDDPGRIDMDVVVRYLTSEAYWATWRSREDITHQFRDAWRVVAAYHVEDGRMVGAARAVSDGIAMAYLADVFVLAPHRCRGVGQAIVSAMIEEGPGADFRWMLHTADAHALYARFGFAPPDPTFMERPRRRAPR